MAYVTTQQRAERGWTIHWGALVGGLALAWSCQVVLTLIGVAVGLVQGGGYGFYPLENIGAGVGVWSVIANVIAGFLGAYFVVRIGGETRRDVSLLQGAVFWAFAIVVGSFFASALSASSMMSSMAMSANAGTAMRTTARAAGTVAGVGAGALVLSLLASLSGAIAARDRLLGKPLREEFTRRPIGAGSHQPYIPPERHAPPPSGSQS